MWSWAETSATEGLAFGKQESGAPLRQTPLVRWVLMTHIPSKAISVLKNKEVMKNNNISNHWHLLSIYIPVLYTHHLISSSWLLDDADENIACVSETRKTSHTEVKYMSPNCTVSIWWGQYLRQCSESSFFNQGRKNTKGLSFCFQIL